MSLCTIELKLMNQSSEISALTHKVDILNAELQTIKQMLEQIASYTRL